MSQQKTGLVPGILVGLVAMLVGAAANGALVFALGSGVTLVGLAMGALIGLAITLVKPTSLVLPVIAVVLGLVSFVLGEATGRTLLLVADLGLDAVGPAIEEAVASLSTPFQLGKLTATGVITGGASGMVTLLRVNNNRRARLRPNPGAYYPPPVQHQPQPEGNLFAPKNPNQG